MALTISEAFTATGDSAVATVTSGAFVIAGTFSGTVELQRKVNDVWQTIASYSRATVDTDKVSFDNGAKMDVRFSCTDYTSGTIECDLEGLNVGFPYRESR